MRVENAKFVGKMYAEFITTLIPRMTDGMEYKFGNKTLSTYKTMNDVFFVITYECEKVNIIIRNDTNVQVTIYKKYGHLPMIYVEVENKEATTTMSSGSFGIVRDTFKEYGKEIHQMMGLLRKVCK